MPPPDSRVRRFGPRSLEAAAAAVFSLYVAWPYLSLTQHVTGYDTVTYSGPNLAYWMREVKGGHLPQWNDQIFGGVPFIANPQTGSLYPLKLLFLPLAPSRALPLITAMHLLVLAGGLYVLLARSLSLRPPAALVGTAAAVGSGLVMVRSLQFEQIAVIAWIPWVLAGIEQVARRDRLGGAGFAGLAVATALLLLAGHPQQLYMALPLIAMWAVARSADLGDTWRARGARLLRVGAAGATGVALAAPQLLVTAAQLGALATTGGRSLQIPSDPGYILAPSRMHTALLGAAFDPQPTDTAATFEATSFVGATVLVLAAIGFAAHVRRPRWRWTAAGLAAVAAFGLVIAFGPGCHYGDPAGPSCDGPGAGYRFLFFHLPAFDLARVPSRWMLLPVLGLALLAALATDAIVARRVSRAAVAVGVGLLAASVLAAAVRGANWTASDAVQGRDIALWVVAGLGVLGASLTAALGGARVPGRVLLATALVPVATMAVELGVPASNSVARQSLTDRAFDQAGTALDDFLRGRPERTFAITSQKLDDYGYLARALRPNTNLFFGVRALDGYDGGVWIREGWVRAMDPFTADGFNKDLTATVQTVSPPNPALLARFGVRYLVVDIAAVEELYGIADPGSDRAKADARKLAADGYRGPVVVDGDLEVYENPEYREEGRLVSVTRDVDPAWPLWSRTLGDLSLDEALMRQGDPGERRTCEGGGDACRWQPVALARPRAGAIDAAVTAARPGVVVVPEQWATGWQATVDGRDVPIQRVDAMSIGIPVDAGAHRIELRYQAPGLRLGLLLAAIGAAAVAVALWDPRARRADGAHPT